MFKKVNGVKYFRIEGVYMHSWKNRIGDRTAQVPGSPVQRFNRRFTRFECWTGSVILLHILRVSHAKVSLVVDTWGFLAIFNSTYSPWALRSLRAQGIDWPILSWHDKPAGSVLSGSPVHMKTVRFKRFIPVQMQGRSLQQTKPSRPLIPVQPSVRSGFLYYEYMCVFCSCSFLFFPPFS